MGQTTERETLIRRYLLGEARDEEQEQTEQRLLIDRQYFEDYLRLEECLIDEYVRGGLNRHDRERFETYFMKAPERQESVNFARALRRNLSQEALPNSTGAAGEDHKGIRWARYVSGIWQARTTAVMATLLCLALLSGAGTVWLLGERTRLKRQIEQLHSEMGKPSRLEEDLKQQIDQQRALGENLSQQLNQAEARLGEKEQEIAKLKQAAGPNQAAVNASVVSMILVPGLGRGEDQANRVYISNGIDRLRLKLEVNGGEYKNYRAEVQTAEGVGIFKSDKLKVSRRGRTVEVELAAKRLAKGDYLLVLSGATRDGKYEKISTYPFRVVRP